MEIGDKEKVIVEFIKLFISERWVLMKGLILSIILGLLIAITTPKEYKAEIELISINPGGYDISESIGGLAGLAGIKLPNRQTEGINPNVYENILTSDEFIINSLNKYYFVESINDSTSLKDYLFKYTNKPFYYYLFGFPKRIISTISSMLKSSKDFEIPDQSKFNYYYVSIEEEELIKEFKKRFYFDFDKEKSIIYLEMELQDPVLAAMVLEETIFNLQKYIDNYLTNDKILHIDFIKKELIQKEKDFIDAQLKLAQFKDTNLTLSTNLARSEEEKLTSKYNLAFTLYSTLMQSYEQAKIDLNKKKPIIQKVSKIKIPIKAAKPTRLNILMSFVVFGFLLTISFIFSKSKIKGIIKGASSF